MIADFTDRIDRDGFCLIADFSSTSQVEGLQAALDHGGIARSERGGQTYGARNLLGLPAVEALAASPAIAEYVGPLLGNDFSAVRGLFFDKTPDANWPVLWHQDLSLAVKAQRNLPGWTNWSVKRGIPHVQPPAEILEQMVTLRLHLDDCLAENGALRVVAGSHHSGAMSREIIQAKTQNGGHTIAARAGDALFMRPLILHASSPSQTPSHRRVLHLEFAPAQLLPVALAWAKA